MLELGIVILLGLSLLPILTAIRGRAHPTAFCWAICGLIFWLTGVALALGDIHSGFVALSLMAGPISANLFWIGARHLARRPKLEWIPAFAVAGSAATGIGFATLGHGAAVAIEIAASFPVLAASAWQIGRHAWQQQAGLSEKALAVTVGALAVLAPTDLIARQLGDFDALLVPAWTAGAFSVAFLLLATLGDRAGRRARRLTEELAERSEALELERSSLLALLEAIPTGIVLSGADRRIRYLNAHAAWLIGVEHSSPWSEERSSEAIAAVRARVDPARLEDLDRWVIDSAADPSSSKPFEIETDDRARILRFDCHDVRDPAGRSTGRLWICDDVTDDRRLADRLGQAERMETVGTLAGGIAHDFNNQLTAILGNLDLLFSELPETSGARPAARRIEASALHCAELTQGLLAFSQRRAAQPGSLDLDAVVKEAVELLRPGMPPGVRIETSLDDDVGTVMADASDFRRVVVNLGVNARAALTARPPERGPGTLTIEARRAPQSDVPRVEILITDDGIGMDETTQRRIFDPFFTTKPLGEGTGLGLSIVYSIVESHGARIEVESRPDEGTRFRLLWPAGAEAATQPSDPAGRLAESAPARGRVLLADDDDGVREAIRAMLERAGYSVIPVRDGDSAVESLRKTPQAFDVVLMDLAMPGRNGLDAAEAIEQIRPGQPIVLISGDAGRFEDHEAFPQAEILRKPFRSDELVERVRKAMATPARD